MADRRDYLIIIVLIAIAAAILIVLISKNSPFRPMAVGESATYKNVVEYNSGRPSESPPRDEWRIITDRQGRVVGVKRA